MAAMGRHAVEPPHELTGSVVLPDLDAGCEFYNDIIVAPLDHGLDTAARKTEIDFFKSEVCARRSKGSPG